MMTMMVLLLAVTVATAQRGQSQRGEDKLFSELNLTAEQQAQIKAIREEGRAEMKELRQQGSEQRPDRESMKKMRESAKEKVQAILTPEQRKKLDSLKAERKAALEAVDKKALKADLKAHTETKIKPVISAARARLDQVISAEDQAAIERLRPVFANKPGRKATRSGDKGKKPSEEERAANKAEAEQWKIDHATEIAELKALTAKYEADLKSMKDAMAPQREQWKKEKREIAARYLPEGAETSPGRPEKAKHKRGKAKPGKANQRKTGASSGEKEDWPRSSAFLLMKS